MDENIRLSERNRRRKRIFVEFSFSADSVTVYLYCRKVCIGVIMWLEGSFKRYFLIAPSTEVTPCDRTEYRRVPLVLFHETVIHHFHTSVRGNSDIKTNIIKHHHKSSTTTLCNLSSIPCSCRYCHSDGVGDFEFY